MEILLIIAIMAVGVSGLYVAATFNTRARRNFTSLMNDAAKNISEEIAAAGEELGKQMQVHTVELRKHGDLVRSLEAASDDLRQQAQAHTVELRGGKELIRRLEAASDELGHKIQAINDEVRQNGELVKHFEEQVGAQQNKLGGDLGQLRNRVADFSDSLARQSGRISGIYRYVIRHEILAGSTTGNDSLLLAMLEAESYVDDMGWGGRPHLYALTENTSPLTVDGESGAGERGDQADALVLVDRGRLPDGDLAEVLAGIHWPADITGCVLVTELTALPSRGGEDEPADPVAARQWASAHPDGRAARLAVGVRRSGEHRCGLHIKGEDEMQARADLARDLVTALMRTF
jgi:hypothetical protein